MKQNRETVATTILARLPHLDVGFGTIGHHKCALCDDESLPAELVCVRCLPELDARIRRAAEEYELIESDIRAEINAQAEEGITYQIRSYLEAGGEHRAAFRAMWLFPKITGSVVKGKNHHCMECESAYIDAFAPVPICNKCKWFWAAVTSQLSESQRSALNNSITYIIKHSRPMRASAAPETPARIYDWDLAWAIARCHAETKPKKMDMTEWMLFLFPYITDNRIIVEVDWHYMCKCCINCGDTKYVGEGNWLACKNCIQLIDAVREVIGKSDDSVGAFYYSIDQILRLRIPVAR